MTERKPSSVPKEPGRWRAIALAVAVHGALLALLWVGIRWQSETPIAVEAEIWSPTAREAAPLPKPPPEPEPEPPKPVVKPAPQPPEPEVEKPQQVDPDIALEQEKKRKEKKERQAEQDRLEKEKKRKLEEERAEKDKKLKAEQDRKDKLKQQEEADAQDKKRKEALAQEKKRKQDAADAELLKKMRDDDMRRITGVTGTGGSGQAARSEGSRADAGYLQKVAARIRSNTIFNAPETLSGNPAVEYDVELLPDGSLRGEPKLRKPSGVPGFDEAVRRAIEKSQPFPADKSGAVPGRITVSHKPKDQ